MDAIEELAQATGATSGRPPGPREVVSFVVDGNGRLVVTTADGETVTAVRMADLPTGFDPSPALTTETFLRELVPDLLRYGGMIPAGVRFYRRPCIVCGEHRVEFREAGR